MDGSGSKIKTYIFGGAIIVAAVLLFWGVANNQKLGSAIGMQKTPVVDNSAAVPHRAIYDVRLKSVRGDNQLVDIKGSVAFEWKDMCENWSTSHSFNVVYDYEGLPSSDVVTEFDALESKSGETLYFTLNRARSGEITEQIRGAANLSADHQTGQAVYTLPQAQEKDLPPRIYFPVEHMFMMIEKARAGEKLFNAYLFEGSDLSDPIEVNAFVVGAAENVAARFEGAGDIDGSLLSGAAWTIRLAFYDGEEGESSVPKYEMDAVLHENGVVSDMVIEYPGFTVSQTLSALEALDVEACQSR